VSGSWLSEAALVMNCRVRAFPFLYLGLPIGGDPRKLDFWKPILNSFSLDCRTVRANFCRLAGV